MDQPTDAPTSPEPRIELLGELPPKLAAALVQAQRNAKAVEKRGRNAAHSYDYVKMEDLIDGGKEALNAAGLALIPCDMDQRRFVVGTLAVMNYDLVRDWIVVHESGAALNIRVVWPLYLQGGKRARDKAVSAADTTMLGYLYRDLLGIPRLAADQMDARDDTGTSEPGQAPSKPAKAKPAPKAKPAQAAKPPKKAAQPPAAAPPLNLDKTPNERPAPVDTSPETGTGEGGTTKRGKTKAGQTYGETADEAKEQRAQLSDEQVDDEVRKALAMGITPATTNDSLVVDLPPDPSADDLEGAGWPKALAEELVNYEESSPVLRKPMNAITRQAAKLLGYDTLSKEAKAIVVPAFLDVGVDVKSSNRTTNGYQLRLWAMAIASIASADQEQAVEQEAAASA